VAKSRDLSAPRRSTRKTHGKAEQGALPTRVMTVVGLISSKGIQMSLVEQKYNEAVDRMTGRERVERTFSLFGSMCEMLTLQISREFSNLSDRETRKKVAERLYVSDKGAQELLKRIRVD
jgi:hypothetical protein